jgi:hypothetical protein
VPTFEVSHSRGWYEAECRELGVTITARRLEEIEATARRTAARAPGPKSAVAIVMAAKKKGGVLGMLAGLLVPSRRPGRP